MKNEEEPQPNLNTQEFVAGWQSIVEEHVVNVHDLADALRALAAADPAGSTLARHVTHALQMAASPTGSVHAAVQYLRETAGKAGESRNP